MCTPLAVLATATTVGGGLYSANAQNQSGVAMNSYYQSLAQQDRQLGASVIAQGERQSNLIQDQAAQEGKQLKTGQAEFNASTRAQLAANGVQGQTVNDIQNNNFTKQQLDESLLRYNADAKSYEARTKAAYDSYADNVQANNYDFQGRSAKAAGRTGAISTLLGTATSVANFGAAGGFSKLPITRFSTGGGFNNTAPFNSARLNLLR